MSDSARLPSSTFAATANALCDAAELFQAACNEMHRAQQCIEEGEGGTPVLSDVEAIYSERWRTLTRDIYYLRKAIAADSARR